MRTETSHKLRMLGVEDVREANELKLLHVIRDRQPISRADLVKAHGVRPVRQIALDDIWSALRLRPA